MTQIAKLHAALLARQTLTFAEFQRLLTAFGFSLRRVGGSHHIYERPGIRERINVQPDGKMAKPYQLRQFADIIERNGLSLGPDQ